MTSRIYAAAVAAALVFGSSAAFAQATPPVGDPTGQGTATPKQKVDNGTDKAPTSSGTATQTTGSGTASSGGGTAPSAPAK